MTAKVAFAPTRFLETDQRSYIRVRPNLLGEGKNVSHRKCYTIALESM
jgi:hypothetical protein